MLGGSRQRTLLALLLMRPNEVVFGDRLIDELWGARPLRTAANALQYYVSQFRKTRAPSEAIVTHEPGYLIRVGPGELDLLRFERLVDEARTAPPAQAAQLLREALGLSRGPALADLAHALCPSRPTRWPSTATCGACSSTSSASSPVRRSRSSRRRSCGRIRRSRRRASSTPAPCCLLRTLPGWRSWPSRATRTVWTTSSRSPSPWPDSRAASSKADPALGRRDASRLLARASLMVQQVVGIVTEPVLVAAGEAGIVEAARDARLLVLGLSERWRSEGLGSVRLAVAAATGVPTPFVRRGPRPGGLAPHETLTRFTWTLTAAAAPASGVT